MKLLSSMTFAVLILSCANQIDPSKRKINENAANASNSFIDPQVDGYSKDTGLVFYNKVSKNWIYQSRRIHPMALKLREAISAVSDNITDDVFAKTVLEALKNIDGSSIVVASDVKGADLVAFEKLKALHDFVATYLTYDMIELDDGTTLIKGQSMHVNYKKIIRAKKAVCAGYSILFKAACDVAKIPGVRCWNSLGYSRRVSVEPSETGRKRAVVRQTLHAWNMVEVQNSKYIIDTTWDGTQNRSADFADRYSTSFLFIDPKTFIYSHIPHRRDEQLLLKPYEMGKYLELPNFSNHFFAHGMKFIDNINLMSDNDNDLLEFRFLKTENVSLIAEVEDIESGIKETVYPVVNGGLLTFTYLFKKPGLHELNIYLRAEDHMNDWVGSFFVNHR